MNIIILGPQGSGKGIQVELLLKKFVLVPVRASEVLRRIADENSEMGRKVTELMKKGVLVPDETIMKGINFYFTEENLSKGLIFDGFPRILSQANLLEKELRKHNREIHKVLVLEVSRDESLKRLSARRICPRCGKIYNLITIPPKHDEECDICRVKLIARADETPDAIETRLKTYREKTIPVIEYYRERGLVSEINGEQPVEDVFQDILKALE